MVNFPTKPTTDGRTKQKVYNHFCPYCPRSFTCPHNVMQHINEQHRTDRDHKCSVCTATFARPWTLSRHLLNVHNIDVRPGRGKPGEKRKRDEDPAPARRARKLRMRAETTHQLPGAAPVELFSHHASTDHGDDHTVGFPAGPVHSDTKDSLIEEYNHANADVGSGNEAFWHPRPITETEDATGSAAETPYNPQTPNGQCGNEAPSVTGGQSRLLQSIHTNDDYSMEFIPPTTKEHRSDYLVTERLSHGGDQNAAYNELFVSTNEREDSVNPNPLSADEDYTQIDNDTIEWLNEVDSLLGNYTEPRMADAEDILSRL